MRLEVEVSKRFAFAAFGVLLVLFGVLVVSAQFNVPNPGHAGSDICDNSFCVSYKNLRQTFIDGGILIGVNNVDSSFLSFLDSDEKTLSNIAYHPDSDYLGINDYSDGQGGAHLSADVLINPYSDNGNVGIGTGNPNEKLHVGGNILASGTVCGTNGCIGDAQNSLRETYSSQVELTDQNTYYNIAVPFVPLGVYVSPSRNAGGNTCGTTDRQYEGQMFVGDWGSEKQYIMRYINSQGTGNNLETGVTYNVCGSVHITILDDGDGTGTIRMKRNYQASGTRPNMRIVAFRG